MGAIHQVMLSLGGNATPPASNGFAGQSVIEGLLPAYQFKPTWISGCTGWLESALDQPIRGLVQGSQPQFWSNFGSSATSADQGTASSRPTYQINNPFNPLPTHAFDGVGDFYRINFASSNLVTGAAYTIYAVVNLADGGASSGTANFNSDAICGDGNGTWGIAIRANNIRLFHDTPTAEAAVPYSINTWYLVEAFYDGTNLNINLNGGPTTQTAVGNCGTAGQFRIGRTFGSGNTIAGKMPLLVLYNRTLTADERQLSRFAWGKRYKISVAA